MSRTSRIVVLGLVVNVLASCQIAQSGSMAEAPTDDREEGGAGGQELPNVGVGGSAGTAEMNFGGSNSGGAHAGGANAAGAGGARAGGQSGSPDAGNADTGSSKCPALFCEDFESGPTLDRSRWNVETGYSPSNSIAVEGTNPAHGRYAAHAHLIDTEGGWARFHHKKNAPVLGTSVWGRAYFFTRTNVPSHTTYISAWANGKSVFEIGGGDKWGLNYYTPQHSEYPTDTPNPIIKDKWMCVEWNFATTGSTWVQLYVNAILIRAWKPGDVSFGHGALTDIGLGIDNHDPLPNQDVYIDDIVIDSKRVGCLP